MADSQSPSGNNADVTDVHQHQPLRNRNSKNVPLGYYNPRAVTDSSNPVRTKTVFRIPQALANVAEAGTRSENTETRGYADFPYSAAHRALTNTPNPAGSQLATTRARPSAETNNGSLAGGELVTLLSRDENGQWSLPRDIVAHVYRSAEERMKEKSRNKGVVPRPANAFVLYRMAFGSRVKNGDKPLEQQNQISKVVATSWHAEDGEIKDWFRQLAARESENHRTVFPNYKFSPAKPARRSESESDADGRHVKRRKMSTTNRFTETFAETNESETRSTSTDAEEIQSYRARSLSQQTNSALKGEQFDHDAFDSIYGHDSLNFMHNHNQVQVPEENTLQNPHAPELSYFSPHAHLGCGSYNAQRQGHQIAAPGSHQYSQRNQNEYTQAPPWHGPFGTTTSAFDVRYTPANDINSSFTGTSPAPYPNQQGGFGNAQMLGALGAPQYGLRPSSTGEAPQPYQLKMPVGVLGQGRGHGQTQLSSTNGFEFEIPISTSFPAQQHVSNNIQHNAPQSPSSADENYELWSDAQWEAYFRNMSDPQIPLNPQLDFQDLPYPNWI